MKKLICFILAVSMLFLLPSCSQEKKETEKTTEVATNPATIDEGYPIPDNQNWEPSDNATGARFNFNLKQYTDNFNVMYSKLGGSAEQLDYGLWQKTSENQVDENGIVYDSYYYASDGLVLTATVEKESDKIMNLGCGTTVSLFVDTTETQHQTVILGMTGVMACVAGGYPVDDVTFFGDLFVNCISNNNNSFWYNNCIYLVNIEEGSTDDDSTVLFRLVPATDSIEKEWNLENYIKYLENQVPQETTETAEIVTSPKIEGAEQKKQTEETKTTE